MNLPREVWRALKIMAAETDRTATDIVVKLAEKHVESRKKKKAS